MKLVTFMTSNQGRIARVVLGIILITAGLFFVKDTAGTILALFALIPIAGGVLDFCVVGVVLGYPFRGTRARERLAQEQHKL